MKDAGIEAKDSIAGNVRAGASALSKLNTLT